ncbi:hypothetical protein FBQ97_11450 [Acidobacteria bacterium ACD]|nr:MAG: hypothetical protein EDX89_24210 [Acidobacteriota bacterium]MCE7958140.1 hypothetical protein [Acidobacteria bacterium ACB2]MDL1950415.1 hypothetical protein [Acidobacteria bacterium ACD]
MPKATVFYPSHPDFALVRPYYAVADFEPNPPPNGEFQVTKCVPYSSFKNLVELIWDSQVSHPIVVTHGSDYYGVHIPLVPNGHSTGRCLYALLLLVDYIELTQYRGPGSPGLLDLERVAQLVDGWGIPASAGLDIAYTCFKIRKSSSVCATFNVRGCEIGADPEKNLRPLGRLFDSNVVTAPRSPMFYVRVVKPFVGNVDGWAERTAILGRRWRYKDPSRPTMILDIEYAGDKAESQVAVAKLDGMGKWAQVMLKLAAPTANSGYIVAGLYPHDDDDYHLAHESGYVSRIVKLEWP